MKAVKVILVELLFIGWCGALDDKFDYNVLKRQAEESFDEELKEQMKSGATSKRFVHRKITPFSQRMSKRNRIFQRIQEQLENSGYSKNDSVQIAYKSVTDTRRIDEILSHSNDNHGELVFKRPGGQNNAVAPIPILQNACSENEPTCTGESNNPFRKINGQCNNFGGATGRKLWGSISIKLRRMISQDVNKYSSTRRTRMTTLASNVNCPSLADLVNCNAEKCRYPNARLVSTTFHPDNPAAEAQRVTHMVTQMGQFLDHDITFTPEEDDDHCCSLANINNPSGGCFPITIPTQDPFYAQYSKTCLDFRRSSEFCTPERTMNSMFPVLNPIFNAREQMNGITAFVDASNVYGSIDGDSGDELSNEAWDLRMRDGTGKMKVGTHNLLPKLTTNNAITGGYQGSSTLSATAGDVRASEMPGLASMHTIFLREHNRICDLLSTDSRTNGWGDEAFYQNARRILIAEMQNVVYEEYLPEILGSKSISDNDLTFEEESTYSTTTDPSIFNSFATAAFRFGHSMIQGFIQMCDITTGNIKRQYHLSQNYFNLQNYERDSGQGMEEILMGLVTQRSQGNDKFVTEEVTNKLFPEHVPSSTGGFKGRELNEDSQKRARPPFLTTLAAFGEDLVARNIQRGRDHGLPGYVKFWKQYGRQPGDLADITCWSHKPTAISQENWNVLKTLYHDPRQIDLFVGGLAETPSSNNGYQLQSLVGPTFNKIIALQFRALKYGDRYFYTHKSQAGSFSVNGQRAIKERRLSDIICDNSNIQTIPSNVFQIVSPSNTAKICEDSQQIDLSQINLFDVPDPIGLRNTQPVDGRWSPWGAWGICSRSCGGGTKTRRRRCDAPAPSRGGRNCVGTTTQTGMCNSHRCFDKGSCTFVSCRYPYQCIRGRCQNGFVIAPSRPEVRNTGDLIP